MPSVDGRTAWLIQSQRPRFDKKNPAQTKSPSPVRPDSINLPSPLGMVLRETAYRHQGQALFRQDLGCHIKYG